MQEQEKKIVTLEMLLGCCIHLKTCKRWHIVVAMFLSNSKIAKMCELHCRYVAIQFKACKGACMTTDAKIQEFLLWQYLHVQPDVGMKSFANSLKLQL